MLEDRINKDYVAAMKDRDSVRSAAINYLRAMIKQVKVDKRLEVVDDAEVISVIRKQLKQRQDSIEQFIKGGRQDLVSKEQAEVEIMKVYLPAEASIEVIGEAVVSAIKESGATSLKDMGMVIKLAREKLGPSADGKVVSDLVRGKLSAI